MLEKKISGKIYKSKKILFSIILGQSSNSNPQKAISNTAALLAPESTQYSIEPESGENLAITRNEGSHSGLPSIEEDGTPSLDKVGGHAENYFQRINRENKEYQESLKNYFDSYFKNMKEEEAVQFGLFKTSRLKR